MCMYMEGRDVHIGIDDMKIDVILNYPAWSLCFCTKCLNYDDAD